MRQAAVLQIVAAFLLLAPTIARAQPFVTPLGGVPYRDWTIVNYVDLQPGGGVIDYEGGNYTYDGHNAIDFTLSNFAQMDAGVPVYAADDGMVTAVHDGEFDRCSRVNPCGDSPNYVRIDHGGGVVTEYLHLKKDSITVSLGQQVTAGQTIAEVGSSGLSTDAHLHFAVYQNGTAVETYQSPGTWWMDPLPYAGDAPGFLDHGIVDHSPTDAEFVERPLDHDVYPQSGGAGQLAYLWSHLHGITAGDNLEYTFYRPDGSQYANFSSVAPQIRYGWWYSFINLPTVPDTGIWRVDLDRNGGPFISDAFAVVDMPGDFNLDGRRNASDYVLWRNYALSSVAYETWRTNYAGAGSARAVPEPASLVTLSVLTGVALARRSRRQ